MARTKTPKPEKIEHSTNVVLQDIQRIDPNPWQPRLTFDPEVIRELATSIRDNGLQQYPAGRETDAPDGTIQLVFGWQRVMAFRQLAADDPRYSEIPIVIREYTDQEMAFAAMEENRARKDLTPIEEAKAWKRLMDEWPELGPTELGTRFGLDKSTISYAVNTLGLPEAVLKTANELGMALGVIRELLCLHAPDHTHEEAMLYVLGKIDADSKPTRGALHDVLHRAFEWPTGRDETPGEWRTMQAGTWNGAHFDPNEFEKKVKGQIHYIPGATPVTCNFEEWDKWQQEADDAANAVKAEQKKNYSVVELVNPDPVEEAPAPAAVKEEPSEQEAGLPEFDLIRWLYERDTSEYHMECADEVCNMDIEGVWDTDTDEWASDQIWGGHEDDPVYKMAAHVVAAHGATVEELIPPQYEMDDDGAYWFVKEDRTRWLQVNTYGRDENEEDEPERVEPPTLDAEQLLELLPEARPKPTVQKKYLPADFDFKAQQEALAKVREMLSQDNSMDQINKDDPDLVQLALGSRATIYGAYSLSYGEHKDLATYELNKLKAPQECVKQCAWGAARQSNSLQRSNGEVTLDKICVNMACFNAKQRMKTREKSDAGKKGMEEESIVVDLAAQEMLKRGTLNLGPAECKVLLRVLSKGYDMTNGAMVYWSKVLSEKLGSPDKEYDFRTPVGLSEAFVNRSDDELRHLVGSMLLEHLRYQGKPLEWTDQLKPWLQDLELGDVQKMASKVQESGEVPAAKPKTRRRKKAAAKK